MRDYAPVNDQVFHVQNLLADGTHPCRSLFHDREPRQGIKTLGMDAHCGSTWSGDTHIAQLPNELALGE